MKITSHLSSALCCVLSVLLAVGTLHSKIAMAQTAATDFEIPTITSAELEEEADGGVNIKVGATDNKEVAEVSLFYRYGENDSYRQIQLDRTESGIFTARLAPANTTDLQYYIEAKDASGNKTQRGNSYFPNVMELSRSGDGGVAQKKPNYLYYILGALAVGALAGLAGSSGGGGGSEGEPTTCCTVTINTTPQ